MVRDIKPTILLTGASGYIGGELLARLLERGLFVRCLVRSQDGFPERDQVETVVGDACHLEDLKRSLSGIKVAFYLIHSLGTNPGKFESQDRHAAKFFAQAAKECGVQRIIYLSGLGGRGDQLSPHLRSRQEVGEILQGSGLQVIEFRASIILGNGSASYEIVRALVQKLPFMVAPRWIKSLCQPIFIDDVIEYLIAAIERTDLKTGVIEIGGRDQVRYVDLLYEYAKQTKRMCKIWIVPLLTPRLSSLWLGLVTPVYARIGRALIEGIKNDTVVVDKAAKELFDVEPIGYQEAIERCIKSESTRPRRTWMSAISAKGFSIKRRIEGKKLYQYKWEGSIAVKGSAEEIFAKITERSALKEGVYARWLWRVRGVIDVAVGGVGLRNVGRDAQLTVGDIVDWWRVEKIEPGRSITLLAEMYMPGIARFIFSTTEGALHLKAEFTAAGLWGRLYWWATYPFHLFLFPGTLKKFKALIEQSRPPSQ